MLNVFLDTNILLDLSLAREPWYEAARSIVEEGSRRERMRCLISPLSLKDLYFVTSRQKTEEVARGFVRLLMEACDLVEVRASSCRYALDGPEPDFEDGLIAAAAVESGADVIISRDAAAFADSPAIKTDPVRFARFFLAESPYSGQTDEQWSACTNRR